MLGRKVEIATAAERMRPRIRRRVEADAIAVFSFQDLPSRLEDILDGITNVTQFLADRSFDEYQRDKLLRLAIERCIEIISEASRHIPPDMKARHAAVPWQKVADIGNVLRHAYQSVDPHIIWEVATRHLTVLREAVEQMQSEIGSSDDGAATRG